MLKARARCSARTPSRINENSAGGMPASPAPSPNRPKNRCQKVFAIPHTIPVIDQQTDYLTMSNRQPIMSAEYTSADDTKQNTPTNQTPHQHHTRQHNEKQ